MTGSIAVLCASGGRRVDGVRDYSRGLVSALSGLGSQAVLIDRHSNGRWIRERVPGSCEVIGKSMVAAILGGSDWLVIQYSPFAFGPRGFAPWVLRLLRSERSARTAVMVHEPYVDWGRGRQRAMSAWQRVQLRAMLARASVVLISTEAWRSAVVPYARRRPAHVAVGSNLPDARAARESVRRELGIAHQQLVIGSLSTGHDSALPGHVAAAVAEAARRRSEIVYLNLGATAPERRPPDVRTLRPGWLPASALAQMLSAVDVFVAPFVDGATTRRTSIIAALQHGVAVVSTDGPRVDDVFRTAQGGVLLAPVAQEDEFARLAGSLAESDRLRASLGSAARRCYEQVFAWPVIAQRVLTELGQLEPVPSRQDNGQGVR